MSALDDSGPAFPVNGGLGANQCNGMTLRDYFAAKAMTVMSLKWDASARRVAIAAYRYADAMLAARATGAAP